MNFLVAMPRETDTSLFTSRVSQGLFLVVCLIGLVLNILVFLQNYRNWSDRRKQTYEDEATRVAAMKSNRQDFMFSTFINLVILVIFVFLIVKFTLSFLAF
ncbi:hypothetical protein [Pseudolactococcus reticulitermitis]|uniref:Uncharacterized protein n=1 Tax=Pseudolactococcus reticulitermitis TaxID=2025039 RepID=A0A224XCV2_9LACT|nr:hypothetical protein [Lactococcus reticulitermitis]GAX47495.1 hypothetical protein RsY01_1095 [Lactococcus reticulitermitis]